MRLWLTGMLLLSLGLIWLGFWLERQPVRCALVAPGAALFAVFGLMGFGPA